MFSQDLVIKYPTATRFLTYAISKNKLANSYILIGKNADDIALIVFDLAKILNCEQNKKIFSTPCENCINCKWLNRNEHPQAVLTINAEPKSKKEQIKIETIRELLNTLKITSDYFRVVLIKTSNLHSLPPESGNLLLKTVEETPPKTIFIFGNTTKSDILPTILSRSQIIYLNKEHNTFTELISNKNTGVIENDFSICFSANLQTCLEKAKLALEYLNENEVNLKDFLFDITVSNYERNKYSNQKQYCFLHDSLNAAYLRSKSFMQPKIVLQDLLLNLSPPSF